MPETPASPKIVVHHLEQSRSHRVLWLLEELGLAYEIVTYARHPKTMRAPDSLRAIHPLGRSPIVTIASDDDATEDLVLVESGAVLEHLVDSFGPDTLRPSDPADLRRYRFWMHYAEGSLMPPLLVRLIFSRLRGPEIPFFLRPLTRAIASKVDAAYTDPEIANHLGFVNTSLGQRPWLAGDAFSAADVQISFPLVAGAERVPGFASRYPNIVAFIERIRARPAYQRAIARGGPVVAPA